MAKLNLSLSGVEVNQGKKSEFSIVPTGTYRVMVSSAEVIATKSGNAIVVGYQIQEGDHAGKVVKDFQNIVNPSETAQRIGLERLATVAWATNAPMKNGVLADTDDLVGKEEFEIYAEQQDDGEYKNMRVKAVVCTREIKAEPKKEEPKKAAAPWKTK